MHHKRGRPKSTRAGCLLCKPHKRQGACLHLRDKFSDRVRKQAADAQVRVFRLRGVSALRRVCQSLNRAKAGKLGRQRPDRAPSYHEGGSARFPCTSPASPNGLRSGR